MIVLAAATITNELSLPNSLCDNRNASLELFYIGAFEYNYFKAAATADQPSGHMVIVPSIKPSAGRSEWSVWGGITVPRWSLGVVQLQPSHTYRVYTLLRCGPHPRHLSRLKRCQTKHGADVGVTQGHSEKKCRVTGVREEHWGGGGPQASEQMACRKPIE